MSVCPICGKNFIKKRTEQKFCSKECGYISKKGKKLYKQSRILEIKVCPVCGKEYISKNDDRKKTCSSECGHKLQGLKISNENSYKYNKDIPMMVCKFCEKHFRPDSIFTINRKGRAQFCSKHCHSESMKKEKISFICKGCGKVFYRGPGRAVSDPNFYCNKSCYLKYGNRRSYKVELMVNWLLSAGYTVETEKTFDWLKNPGTNHNLFLDIFLPEKLIGIEYDGKQHFEPCLGYDNEDDVLYRQILDKLKDHLCLDNNVKILRIKYSDTFNYDIFMNNLKFMV